MESDVVKLAAGLFELAVHLRTADLAAAGSAAHQQLEALGYCLMGAGSVSIAVGDLGSAPECPQRPS
jgi:hypothetical protein